MSSTVRIGVELLRQPEAVFAAAREFASIQCIRCRAEGPSPNCPNCGGISGEGLRDRGHGQGRGRRRTRT